MNLRVLRRCCFFAGAGLLLWTSVEFFLLAFLTSRFIEGAGILLWARGFMVALRSSPTAIAGFLLVIAGLLLRKAR